MNQHSSIVHKICIFLIGMYIHFFIIYVLCSTIFLWVWTCPSQQMNQTHLKRSIKTTFACRTEKGLSGQRWRTWASPSYLEQWIGDPVGEKNRIQWRAGCSSRLTNRPESPRIHHPTLNNQRQQEIRDPGGEEIGIQWRGRVLLEVDKPARGTERKGLGQSRRRPTSLEAKEEGGDGESLPASVLSRVSAGMKWRGDRMRERGGKTFRAPNTSRCRAPDQYIREQDA
jgi:hypothetical protein